MFTNLTMIFKLRRMDEARTDVKISFPIFQQDLMLWHSTTYLQQWIILNAPQDKINWSTLVTLREL